MSTAAVQIAAEVEGDSLAGDKMNRRRNFPSDSWLMPYFRFAYDRGRSLPQTPYSPKDHHDQPLEYHWSVASWYH